jgi:DNA repair exonuclease SbcCD nuclease subunit
MIKRIIHLADLHIPNKPAEEHTEEKIKNLIKTIIQEVKPYKKEEVRIVLVGDIFQNKIRTTNEAKDVFHYLLNYLNQIAVTYIVAGNHDMLQNNRSRLDSISPTFTIKNAYSKIKYIDKELGYKSGYVIDDNVIFALFSMFEDFKNPNLDGLKETYPDNRIVGLYHGDIVGSVIDLGRYSEAGIDTDNFKECDCVMAGHIHRFQEIRKNGVPIVYSGSVFQKDSGENISGHGIVVWNMEDMTYEFKEVDNDYRMLKFSIEDYDDVKNDTERLLNL